MDQPQQIEIGTDKAGTSVCLRVGTEIAAMTPENAAALGRLLIEQANELLQTEQPEPLEVEVSVDSAMRLGLEMDGRSAKVQLSLPGALKLLKELADAIRPRVQPKSKAVLN